MMVVIGKKICSTISLNFHYSKNIFASHMKNHYLAQFHVLLIYQSDVILFVLTKNYFTNIINADFVHCEGIARDISKHYNVDFKYDK